MGMVTRIHARSPGGEWVPIYDAPALTSTPSSTYWYWLPSVCRTHFLTTDLRVEIDTSEQTGVADWNYIDYVKLYGASTLQAAAHVTGM